MFDDRGWAPVDVPYDFVLRGAFAPDEKDAMHGYLPRDGAGWYRKRFRAPAVWEGSRVLLEFDGVFHVSRIWLNGIELPVGPTDGGGGNRNGYTGFHVRLDALPAGLRYGAGAVNHLALRADASFGSGHWYEGGGIFRNVRIVRSDLFHIRSHGVSAMATLLPSGAAVVNATMRVHNEGGPVFGVQAELSLIDDATGGKVAGGRAAIVSADGAVAVQLPPLVVRAPALWSVQRPATYTLCSNIVNTSGGILDSVNTTIGIREAHFDTAGFHLNGERVVMRGFSDHNSFAGVGVAVPARVNLFRVQMLRAVGAATGGAVMFLQASLSCSVMYRQPRIVHSTPLMP
jgi:beta-galactosidase/beta-glucuronidase